MLAYSRAKINTFYKEAKDSIVNGICTPRTALVYPSRLCNQNCYFCSDKNTNKESSQKFMDSKIFLDLPKHIKQLGCEAVELCGGGEPFLHPDILEFITECGQWGLKLGSLTNGTMLHGEIADSVVNNFSFIRISIDSFNKETYSNIRGVACTGNNSLEKVIENIKYLVRLKKELNSNLLITVKAVFNESTIDELYDYVNYAKHLGVDGINIKGVRNVEDQLNEESSIFKIYSCILEDIKKNNKIGEPYVFGSLGNSILKTPGCFACNFHVFIDTDGSQRLCCYYQNRAEEHTYGNIKNNSLYSNWYSDEHIEKVKCIDTSKCNLYNCKYHGYNNELYKNIIKDEGQWQFT